MPDKEKIEGGAVESTGKYGKDIWDDAEIEKDVRSVNTSLDHYRRQHKSSGNSGTSNE